MPAFRPDSPQSKWRGDIVLAPRTARTALTLKYASYCAGALLTDTDKLGLSVDYGF